VTLNLSALHIRTVLLDIEGTTTPIDFVYKTLFPYARAHAADYLAREWASVACREAVALLGDEMNAAQDLSPAVVADYVASLMDQDRKSRGLKMLQGLIWEKGYRDGNLHGEVYPDVPPALERWNASGLRVCIYSSGSVLAQQLLFGSTSAGDLTRHIQGYFDTAVGPKTSADSYRRIVQSLGATAPDVLFVSDVAAELDGACAADLRTALCVRADATTSPTLPRPAAYPVIHAFHEIAN
jgi:enolase-phosphatase E1